MPHLATVGRSHEQIILLCRQEPNLTAIFMIIHDITRYDINRVVLYSNSNGFLVLYDNKRVILLSGMIISGTHCNRLR